MKKEFSYKNNILGEKDILGVFTPQDLKKLGLNDVAYIKQYRMNDKTAFVLHAADGTALALQPSAREAALSATHHALDVVSVH